MLRNKSRAHREAVGMREGTVLHWVARDKLMDMTPSDSIPAGNNWHQRRVRRTGRMKANYRDS